MKKVENPEMFTYFDGATRKWNSELSRWEITDGSPPPTPKGLTGFFLRLRSGILRLCLREGC